MGISDVLEKLKSGRGKLSADELKAVVQAVIDDMRNKKLAIKTTSPSAFMPHDNYETLLFNELDREWQKKGSWVISNQPYTRASETSTLSEAEIFGEVRSIIETERRRSELVGFLEVAQENNAINVGSGY